MILNMLENDIYYRMLEVRFIYIRYRLNNILIIHNIVKVAEYTAMRLVKIKD